MNKFLNCLFSVDPPVITHISNNQTLNAGSSMTLNCLADGNPPPVISWTRVSYDSAVIFPLTNIGPQHEGTYRCTANNSVGSAVTGDVSIVVHCEYFAQLPSWTLFICFEFLYAGSLYEIGWEGNWITFSLISLGCLGSCHTKAVFRVMRSDVVESRQLFTANNGVGTVLLDICPYLYIASPLCTFLTLIRQNKFYSNTLRKWAREFT